MFGKKFQTYLFDFFTLKWSKHIFNKNLKLKLLLKTLFDLKVVFVKHNFKHADILYLQNNNNVKHNFKHADIHYEKNKV
jgi:hypothetical protein